MDKGLFESIMSKAEDSVLHEDPTGNHLPKFQIFFYFCYYIFTF